MNAQRKLGLGSVLSNSGALTIVLSQLMEWTVPRPWGFLLGVVIGVVAGFGAILSVTGLIERRRDRQDADHQQ